ncbi:MAG: patatin-like phospholipase family protein [Myxococcota bacterium]
MSRFGLVLAGGASRGAYEAGVLRYVFTELPRQLGYVPWPDIVSGTSVGALNGSFVVARDVDGLQWMARTWQQIELDQVLRVSYGDLLHSLRNALSEKPFSLADPAPLQRMVVRRFPSEQARRVIDEHGVTWVVGATDLVTGSQILFVDAQQPPTWPVRPGVRVVPTRIRASHALASGALPLLFPPIPIGGMVCVDGGLRQNTPLAPALRAGADRVLVVSMKRQAQDLARSPQPANLVFLVGKLMNALLLDPVELDLFDAEQRNQLIDWGTARYGPDFAEAIRDELGLRRAEVQFIAPSEDLGAMAADIYRASPPRLKGAAAQLLDRAAGHSGPDADLLSYVYFDRAFTAPVEALGFEDARRHEAVLADLVSAPPVRGVARRA